MRYRNGRSLRTANRSCRDDLVLMGFPWLDVDTRCTQKAEGRPDQNDNWDIQRIPPSRLTVAWRSTFWLPTTPFARRSEIGFHRDQ